MYEESKFRRNPDVSWRVIEGQAVLVHNVEGEIEVLNEVGTYLWEHADEPLETLARNIAKDYQVAPDEARRDALEFFETLIASGALIPAEG
jgi:3-polyprenyl-4-hydroxybenzoate decarboxylase